MVHLDHPHRRHPPQPTPPRSKSHRPPGPPTLPDLTTPTSGCTTTAPTPTRPRSPDPAVAPARLEDVQAMAGQPTLVNPVVPPVISTTWPSAVNRAVVALPWPVLGPTVRVPSIDASLHQA